MTFSFEDAWARARMAAAREGVEERALALEHDLGSWRRVGRRMDAAMCSRCSRIAYVVAEREGAIIAGGTALEELCGPGAGRPHGPRAS
jgi:hypothetical protein